MARIPMGNFGNRVAAPVVQGPQLPAMAFGADVAGPLAQGLEVAAQSFGVEEQKREQEAKRLERERKQEDEALTRAKAANAVLDREIAVKTLAAEISQQVEAGDIHYNDAPKEFKKRIADLGTPNMAGMDPVTAENFSKGVKRADFSGEGIIHGAMSKARLADFRAQTDNILDKLGKQASLPGADHAAINAQADGLDEVGKRAYGAGWAKKKLDWIAGNWDAHLKQQAMTVRDDLKGIKALEEAITTGPYADKLHSNNRNTIISMLTGYRTAKIQRDEAVANKVQREQERVLKRAEAEFNTFQSLADKGTILAPEYINRVVQMTAGTPYQQGIKMLAQQAQETGGLASQPVVAQEAMLTQVDTLIAQRGRTPELDKRREQIQKVLSGSQADLKANGLRAGLERGVIKDMAPLDISTPEAFASSVAIRLTQAEQVSQWAGKPVSPLDAREAEQVRGMLDALPPKQKSQAVSTIAGAVGPKLAGALAEQVEKQDKPLALAFATAGSSTTAGRYTSELILKGAAAKKDGLPIKDKFGKSRSALEWEIAGHLDGAFPDERALKAAKESANLIAFGLAAEAKGSLSDDDIEAAVSLAIDGTIIKRNGKKLPIPPGWSEDDFARGLRNASKGSDIQKQAPDGKVRAGGVEMSAADFAATVPGQELIYAGPGRYAVIVKGRPVTNSAGKPIIVGVR